MLVGMLQMRLQDAVADSLLGQAQTLSATGKQDEAEQVGRSCHRTELYSWVSCIVCGYRYFSYFPPHQAWFRWLLHVDPVSPARLTGPTAIRAVSCASRQVLGDALSAAEAVSGEAHPRVACVLLELGRLYARTARVSYAEGLYRWCCSCG
jgi:hypothetical protein